MRRALIAATVAVALSAAFSGSALSRSGGSSHEPRQPRLSSGHSRSSHSGRSSRPHRTSNKSGIRFIKRTCKTDACRKKHPSGTYMIAVKPKKSR
ncbi:MAG: hypothetical protein KGL11_02730 [Alphaproteobacteria bacterium]|nr:hypothetical protein [Alphaproteobacteria bacterium]